jgi:hypothetical protein
MSTGTDTESTDGRRALDRLEDELINIEGAASALLLAGRSKHTDPAVGYLGGQLMEHHRKAYEAFEELFKQMKEAKGGAK